MITPAVWFPAIRAGSGADTFTIRLAESLTRRGIRAEIAWLPKRAEFASWTVSKLEIPTWANVVHINSWLHERFIPKGLPIVATVHSCVHDPALDPYKSRAQSLYHRYWIRPREANALHHAVVVTAVSRYAANQAAALFDRKDIVPIPNWVDTQRFAPDGRQQPHEPFHLLFAGNIKRLKGADLLPEIMRRLGPGFVLHYTGMSDNFRNVSRLPDNMVALGRLHGDAAMAAAYLDCDALLFPTRLEGFGLVALEAQACGRPVITSNCSSLPEVVHDGQTGFLCPVDDIEAFVEVARALRADSYMCKLMGEAGRQFAEKCFSEDVAIEKYLSIYAQCLK